MKIVQIPSNIYSGREYKSRNQLDDTHFDTMNKGIIDPFLYTFGCLDAPEIIPAGSTTANKVGKMVYVLQTNMVR